MHAAHREAGARRTCGYDPPVRCPACSEAQLDKHGSCHSCRGIWLPEELVRERLARSLVFTGGHYSERYCPVCDEKMDEPLVFDVPIDSCSEHGMWFDKAELERVIERSKITGWHATAAPAPEDSLRMLVAAVGVWETTKR
jgi:Zn-finger nucleic acid-binding protein